MTTETDTSRSQALAQYASIVEMVSRVEHAAECDGDPDDCEVSDEDVISALGYWQKDTDATDEQREQYHDEDAARERIQEDALSVQVRSDFVSPGEEMTAVEFEILLCTGGPAVRIMGELSEHGEPTHAYIQYQDWFEPWTELVGETERSTLLAYAGEFLGF